MASIHRRLRHPLSGQNGVFIMRHGIDVAKTDLSPRDNWRTTANAGAVPACGCWFIDRPATPSAFLVRLLQILRSGYPAQTLLNA